MSPFSSPSFDAATTATSVDVSPFGQCQGAVEGRFRGGGGNGFLTSSPLRQTEEVAPPSQTTQQTYDTDIDK